MNEIIRRRLVGAAVLIALGILLPFGLAQWLAGSPSQDGENVRVYEITPDGEARPVADAEPRAPENAPAVETKSATTARRSATEPVADPVPEPEPESPPPAEPDTSLSWSVQVGSFRSEENAHSLMDELASAFPVFYSEGEVGGVTYYRVRVGPYTDEAQARRVAAALVERGRKAQLRREP